MTEAVLSDYAVVVPWHVAWGDMDAFGGTVANSRW